VTAEVRTAVYRTFATEGRPPSIGELARITGRRGEEIQAALTELHARHLLVLAVDGDAIRMAHPFSAAPMGFVVRAGDERWWGGCTWDSFGIGAALGRPIRIETSCPACMADLAFDGGPDTPPESELIARIPLPASRWWDDVIWTCSNIRTFCGEGHAEAFAARVGQDLGELVPINGLWRLAGPWYGDRLAADYAPRPRDVSQRILTEAGFIGEFWQLPA
jgi:hypothetical protein